MMSYLSGFGGWYLHGFFCLALAMGLVLLVVWMIKTMKPKQLLTWALILIAAGVLGIMISSMSFGGSYGFRGMMNPNYLQNYSGDFR